jgi:hypothetical protein
MYLQVVVSSQDVDMQDMDNGLVARGCGILKFCPLSMVGRPVCCRKSHCGVRLDEELHRP